MSRRTHIKSQIYHSDGKNLIFVLNYHHLGHILLIWSHQLGVASRPWMTTSFVLFPGQYLAKYQVFLVIWVAQSGAGKLWEVVAGSMSLSPGKAHIKVTSDDGINDWRWGSMVSKNYLAWNFLRFKLSFLPVKSCFKWWIRDEIHWLDGAETLVSIEVTFIQSV